MSHEPKILIVDDDPTLCRSLKIFLRDKYSNIVTAFSGKEAIELLASDTFDLILLDVFMPDINGYQVMDYINRKGLRTSVILISAYAPTELEKETPPKGAYDSIMKPFDLEKLVTTVQNALNRR
jgi:two-component system nitrogen regulation response regulator NtrX